MNDTLKDVETWAVQNGEPRDALRSLRRVPARLGLIDADLAVLSADPVRFEHEIAGRGYALVSRAKAMDAAGRREDSRIRALLRRFHAAQGAAPSRDGAVRARYDALMQLIAAEEGLPGSGNRWAIGRHRSLCSLRARARVAPEKLTQGEIDRIGCEMTSEKRKGLRKTVRFLNDLRHLANDMPELRGFLPDVPLAAPAGSSRARRVAWDALPAPFRDSFEAAAKACLAGGDDLAETLLARIEAGEDPEAVMAEADALGAESLSGVGKPTAAREQYRLAVAWLVRAWEDSGGDAGGLTELGALFDRATIELAIRDQIARSGAAPDLRDPLASSTLKTRLTALTTLAKRGLEDARAVAILKLLRAQHYDLPRKKLQRAGEGEGVQMEVDRVFAMLRQQPMLASLWSNAPRRIAEAARGRILAARAEKNRAREVSGLRLFAGAAADADPLPAPRPPRLASQGEAHANLLRSAPGTARFTFRFAPWEIKNRQWVTVDVVEDDATILRDWIEAWRPRMIALQNLDPETVYLFPGRAVPERDDGDPVALPRGCYSVSAFLELWRDASAILGVQETPHRMRHVVALLILALRPGDYAFVATVLGNTAATARAHYGRDDGEAVAREARAALLAQHPDLFATLKRRHANEG